MRFCSLESDRQKIRYRNWEKRQRADLQMHWSNPASWTSEIQGWEKKKEIAKFEIKYPQLAVSKMYTANKSIKNGTRLLRKK
jgi:hypothetical protein